MLQKLLISISILLAFSVKSYAQCSSTINTFPFVEDFETSDGGWIAGGVSSDWAWGTPQKTMIRGAGSGSKCWITGGLNKAAYNDGENSYLVSPCFDFATLAHPKLSFSVFWETEKRFDGANLQYSTNGGAVWQTLGIVTSNPCTATNWYNNGSITYLGDAGWSGNVQSTTGSCQGGSGSGNWLTTTHDLSFLAGQKVIFRFHFAAGTTCNSFDGFAFDLFSITEVVPGPADFTSTCAGGKTVSFTSITPTCPSGFTWTFGDVGSGANNSSSSPNPTHQFSGTGKFTVTLIVTYAAAPSNTIMHDVEIIDGNIIVTSPILCNGNSNGSLTASGMGSTDPFSYLWNTTPTQFTPAISNLIAGHYVVTITTPNACPAVIPFDLAEPAVIKIDKVITDALCGNNKGAINATVSGGTPLYSYTWSNAMSTPTINNLTPGNYSLQIKDANNCMANSGNIVVGNNNISVPVSLGPKQYLCPGKTIILSPGNFSSYKWQDNSTGSTYTVTSAGQYTVQVTDANGCTGSSMVTITEDCGDIYFPAAFTPNGDTKNELFGAFGNIAAVTNYSFKIFNRYGEMIFATTDPAKRWDGTMKGSKYNTGSFVWFATYTLLGRPNQAQQGTVTLIR